MIFTMQKYSLSQPFDIDFISIILLQQLNITIVVSTKNMNSGSPFASRRTVSPSRVSFSQMQEGRMNSPRWQCTLRNPPAVDLGNHAVLYGHQGVQLEEVGPAFLHLFNVEFLTGTDSVGRVFGE